MRKWLIALCMGTLGAAAFASDPVVRLPQYQVSAAVIAAMIPCDQVRDIQREAKPYRDVFDFSVVTFIKAPASRFQPAPRCYIRARDGHIEREITNPTLQFTVNRTWSEGYLSSNQPVEYADFYFLLRPRLGPGPVTLGEADRLLRAYGKFAARRLHETVRHYGAEGSWTFNLQWATMPDEVDFIATSPAAVARIAQQLDTPAQGLLVRVSMERLAALIAKFGAGHGVAPRADLAVVTPWRFTAGPPPVRDHAALVHVGWVEYSLPGQPPRRDFVGLGLDSAPAGG